MAQSQTALRAIRRLPGKCQRGSRCERHLPLTPALPLRERENPPLTFRAEIKFPFRSYVNVFATALFVTTTWYCCGGISNAAHNISMAHSRSNDDIVAWAVSRLGTAIVVEEQHWLLSGRERCWVTLPRKSSALGAS